MHYLTRRWDDLLGAELCSQECFVHRTGIVEVGWRFKMFMSFWGGWTLHVLIYAPFSLNGRLCRAL